MSELLCELRHLADTLGIDWAALCSRAEDLYAPGSPRHEVEVTTEGFQVLDSETDRRRADVWPSRHRAQIACDQLNEPAPPVA